MNRQTLLGYALILLLAGCASGAGFDFRPWTPDHERAEIGDNAGGGDPAGRGGNE